MHGKLDLNLFAVLRAVYDQAIQSRQRTAYYSACGESP